MVVPVCVREEPKQARINYRHIYLLCACLGSIVPGPARLPPLKGFPPSPPQQATPAHTTTLAIVLSLEPTYLRGLLISLAINLPHLAPAAN